MATTSFFRWFGFSSSQQNDHSYHGFVPLDNDQMLRMQGGFDLEEEEIEEPVEATEVEPINTPLSGEIGGEVIEG